MNLHYAGYQPGASGFGWATCNANLVKALSKLCQINYRAGIRGSTEENTVEFTSDVCFVPLADHDLNPVNSARGKINLAYTFFEFPLGDKAAENAAKYDTVFAGSTWCLERMRERGIANGKLLIQGVDHSIFKHVPSRQRDGQFRIFSGGKFEYRKGQDLVILAFKEFSKKHDDAHLVCSWFNPWPRLVRAELLRLDPAAATAMDNTYASIGTMRLMNDNGLAGRYEYVTGQLTQGELASVMAFTDIGLFPNRCEGGTNLVLMEYASCGRKIVANAKTGHADIAGAISYEIPASTDENHWAVQSVEDIVFQLELAYENRDTKEHWSKSAHAKSWTWEAAAQTIVDEALRLMKVKGNG